MILAYALIYKTKCLLANMNKRQFLSYCDRNCLFLLHRCTEILNNNDMDVKLLKVSD